MGLFGPGFKREGLCLGLAVPVELIFQMKNDGLKDGHRYDFVWWNDPCIQQASSCMQVWLKYPLSFKQQLPPFPSREHSLLP